MSKSKLTNVYFSHDRDARSDDKIAEMMFNFRKLAKGLNREELECLAGISGYAVFWCILEYMHRNGFYEKDIDILADSLRIKPEFIKKILNDFNLFEHEGSEFISKRLFKDIELQNEKSDKAKKAVEARYLMKEFKSRYIEIFGKEPCLEEADIKALKEYADKIPDFREKLPDILYTLSEIKFDDKAKGYKPLTSWLLGSHNLGAVYEGAFSNGALKSWKAEKERRRKLEKEKELEEKRKEEEKQDEFNLDNFSSKAMAIDFLRRKIAELKLKDLKHLPPQHKDLMKKFDITVKEINSS